MTIKKVLGIVAVSVLFTSCDYQKFNSIGDAEVGQKDLRAGDTYVYGVHLDSAAAQTKLKYASKPEYEVRTQKIREKMASQ